MLNKKKTLIIDSDAEEKAKAQAMQQELETLKPKAQSKPQDTSKETNHKALTKIHSRSIKFAIFACLALFVILGLAWSINQKFKNDREKAENETRRQAQSIASEKASKITSGDLSDEARERCDQEKHISNDAYDDCFKKEQIDAINELLQSSSKSLPAGETDELVSLQIVNITSLNHDIDKRKQQLESVEKSIQNSNATYLTYRELALEYVDIDLQKALDLFKIAKQKFIEARQKDPQNNLDAYVFPTTEEEFKIFRDTPDYTSKN